MKAEVRMTQPNIKTIIAAIALCAPLMVPGFAQAGASSQSRSSPPSHDCANVVTKVDCEWALDDRGNLYCMGIPGRPMCPRR